MNADRWQMIKDILAEALERSPGARAAYLADACGDDAELRGEVEKLLEFEPVDRDPLEHDALSAALTGAGFGGELAGRTIGSYRIVGELGAGGMGAVYLAERADGDFAQRVALKLIKRGLDSESVARRFLNERRILASLEHPNIARLIDGGAHDGAPYFVMELVEGENIVDFAERRGLSLDERLTLFADVCAAVSFAHRSLVIHRDLKPSNILVTADGVVKLLDFGIAKLLDHADTAATATETHVFTPDYASPEQFRGEKLTTATDVYSLGVVLYELLTGRRPFRTDGAGLGEIMRLICDSEPARPSTLRRGDLATDRKSDVPNPKSLRGDLDDIVLKALRKEPERRYASVEQFADDIRRHREGLPVTASAGTWKYRAAKFYRRNRVAAVAAVLVAATLVGGLATTLHQRNKAQRRFNDVRRLANSFLFEFHDAIESLPGSTPARELVVRRAVEYLDQLAAESDGDPTLQRELAAAYAQIGQIQGNSYFSNLGDTDGAMKSYRLSLGIRRKLVDADPANLELRHELAASHEGVGDMLYTVGQLEDSLASYEASLAIREKLVADAPANLAFRKGLAEVLSKRGDVGGMEGFPNLGRLPLALDSYGRAVSIYAALVESEPENPKFRLGYAQVLTFQGMLLNVQGDSKGSIANGEKAIVLLQSLIDEFPNNATYELNLMSTLNFIRFPLLDEGRTDKALDFARHDIETMTKQAAQDPKNMHVRRSLGVSYNNLGICLVQAGKAAEAVENHKKSLAIAEELLAGDPSSVENRRDVALTVEFLATAQLAAGDHNGALTNYRQALASLLKEGTDDPNADAAGALYAGLARAMAAKGDFAGAADNIRRAIAFAEKAAQASPDHAKFQYRLAAALLDAGLIFRKLPSADGGVESCGYIRKSAEIWDARRQKSPISKIFAARADETTKELAACR